MLPSLSSDNAYVLETSARNLGLGQLPRGLSPGVITSDCLLLTPVETNTPTSFLSQPPGKQNDGDQLARCPEDFKSGLTFPAAEERLGKSLSKQQPKKVRKTERPLDPRDSGT